MAKTKRTKPSIKPTTKGKDLPESVQWLLDFANIGCKPGKLLLTRVYESTTVKRPPAEPGTIKKLTLDSFAYSMLKENRFKDYDEYMESYKGVTSHELTKIIIRSNKEYDIKDRKLTYLDENGNEWCITPKGEVRFCGTKDDEPSPEEFRDFLSKTGISKGRNMKQEKIKKFWTTAECSLTSKMTFNEKFLIICQGYAQHSVYKHFKKKQIQLPERSVDDYTSLINGLTYSHDNTLVQATCAYILDFWHNHRELHQHLRQCKCCGKYWIEANTRRKYYCCKKCEDRFNQASRQGVRESLRKQRAKQGKDKKEITHNEIINWLCKTGGYTPKKAEEILNNEKHRKSTNVKSLANFKRTYGKRNGLI